MALFADPSQVQDARLLQMAQLDPNQQLFMGAARGAQQLTKGIGSLFGVDVSDPAVKAATKLQELGAKYGTTTADALDKIANDPSMAEFPQLRLEVAQKANELRLTSSKISSEQALTAQRMREKKSASVEEKTFIELAKKASPQSVAAAMKAGNDISLLEIPEAVKVSTYGQVLKDAGFKEGTPEFQAKMKAFADAELEGTRKGKGTNVNVALSGAKAFSEKMGELDAKQVAEAISARNNAFSTIRSLDQLASLDDQGLISGTFATGRVGATNLLNTLGLASPADQQRLASSQNYQKVAGDVILGVLGGKLGAGFSNEDRKFIEGLVPQLETSPTARRQLINFMRRKNMEIAEESTRLETYARENNGLKGFKPKIPMGGNVPASGMSVDDLAKAAGGKIVNGKFVKNQ